MGRSYLNFRCVIFTLRTLEEIHDLHALFDATLRCLKHMRRNSNMIILYHLSQLHRLLSARAWCVRFVVQR